MPSRPGRLGTEGPVRKVHHLVYKKEASPSWSYLIGPNAHDMDCGGGVQGETAGHGSQHPVAGRDYREPPGGGRTFPEWIIAIAD